MGVCLTLVGGWLNTLLGPEGSAVSASLACLWGGVVVVGSSGSSLRPSTRVAVRCDAWWWCVRGLVGLLFEICIVDASIYSSLVRIFWIGLLLEQFE